MALFQIKENPNSSEQPAKRGRGRPRKYPLQSQTTVPTTSTVLTRRWEGVARYKIQVAVIVVVLVLAGTAVYFYKQNQDTKKKLNETTSQKQSDNAAEVIDKIGKHVLLPTDEQPTFTTITQNDLDKVKGQVFFSRAAVGDKVLIYNQAKKAILYRPSIDKIIEMAPLNTEQAQ